MLAGPPADQRVDLRRRAVSPLAATSYLLAKATHAPGLAILMTSGGLLDVAVRPMLLSLGEALDVASAVRQCGGEDSYRWYYQQGRVSCEVVTAAQIDRRARTNDVEVTSPGGRRVRLPGQGGLADVADLHQNFILYLTRQSPLSLVDSVERVSAGRSLHGAEARRRAGLRPGVVQLITNLGVFAYSELRGELVLQSLHPGVSLADLRAATAFEPAVADDLAVTGEPPARDAPGAARGDRPAGDPPAGVRPRPGAGRAAGRVHRRRAGPH